MMVLMLFKQIWIPQPMYRALPMVASVVGAIGMLEAGKSMGMLAVSGPLMTCGLLVMVVRMSWGGLSNGW